MAALVFEDSGRTLRLMSEGSPLDRYVWIWLPHVPAPTLCGHLRWDGAAASFAYVKSYRGRPGNISVQPDWPVEGTFGERLFPGEDDALPPFVADVAPGRWAEYVIDKIAGRRMTAMERLIRGFGDRTGAIEFSVKADETPPSEPSFPELEEVAAAIELLEQGRNVDPKQALLFRHGASLGGRRPKATVMHQSQTWIAKFVSVNDRDRLQPRREAFGLALARRCGIDVPTFKIVEANGQPVLLVARFDRGVDGTRRHVLSARTLLQLSERQMLTAASYPAIAQMLRKHSQRADEAARWFDRMVFNIVLGNTDDHALNHLFGWNGSTLTLMPAFDLEQQLAIEPRTQEMIVGQQGRVSSLENALSSCRDFGLNPALARERIALILRTCANNSSKILTQVGISERSAREQIHRTLNLAAPE